MSFINIPPAWMIEELEKLRREQKKKQEELRIEIPCYIPPLKNTEEESDEQDTTISFNL